MRKRTDNAPMRSGVGTICIVSVIQPCSKRASYTFLLKRFDTLPCTAYHDILSCQAASARNGPASLSEIPYPYTIWEVQVKGLTGGDGMTRMIGMGTMVWTGRGGLDGKDGWMGEG
jgi:hypothetical protein